MCFTTQQQPPKELENPGSPLAHHIMQQQLEKPILFMQQFKNPI
jgi:hypothetical protein